MRHRLERIARTVLRAVARDDRGQGLVEYALIIALVSIALIASLNALAGGLGNAYSTITAAL